MAPDFVRRFGGSPGGAFFCLALFLGTVATARAQAVGVQPYQLSSSSATASFHGGLYQLYSSTATPAYYKRALAKLLQIPAANAGVGTQRVSPGAAPSSTVTGVQISCNPLRPDCQPFRFQNLPTGARLRIYSFAGALIKDLNADGLGQASWDGSNLRGQPASSGVYFVYAQGGGTTKTFKVAIER